MFNGWRCFHVQCPFALGGSTGAWGAGFWVQHKSRLGCVALGHLTPVGRAARVQLLYVSDNKELTRPIIVPLPKPRPWILRQRVSLACQHCTGGLAGGAGYLCSRVPMY